MATYINTSTGPLPDPTQLDRKLKMQPTKGKVAAVPARRSMSVPAGTVGPAKPSKNSKGKHKQTGGKTIAAVHTVVQEELEPEEAPVDNGGGGAAAVGAGAGAGRAGEAGAAIPEAELPPAMLDADYAGYAPGSDNISKK
jgi:hypothetical protein